MDKVLKVRQPAEQSQVALSKASKIFFGCDIFQVVAVVVFQGSMIALGDFSPYNNSEHPGMGPGRRIYMVIYMAAVVYTCFLCLFAVKRQNFMEIVAFDLQNFAFVTYSFIQLYHVGFKRYNGLRTNESDILPKIVIVNALTLLLLNIVFTYLSYKLYMEFGWKIYKRVRFNNKLRGVYQIYELLSCLLKMEILYWGMFGICHSLVLLRDTHNVFYFFSLSIIPLSLMYAALGFYATRHENRWLMLLFLCWTLAEIGYFIYKVHGFITRKCNGCEEFEKNGQDIPQEAFMHFVYLGTTNLIVAMAILGVAIKSFRNFGKGLAEHFNRKKKPQSKLQNLYDLNLERTSHAYPEESVVSVTSYEFDEFVEGARLERCLSPPSLVALLHENGSNLAEKRSCSLPNLLTDLQQRTTPVRVTDDLRKTSLLNARLQKGRPAPGLRVMAAISERNPNEMYRSRSHSNIEQRVIEPEISEEEQERSERRVNDSMANLESPVNGHLTAHAHNGYADNRRDLTVEHLINDPLLTPELKTNRHAIGTARLKNQTPTEIEKACVKQGVNSSYEHDEATQSNVQGVCNGKKRHFQSPNCERSAHTGKDHEVASRV